MAIGNLVKSLQNIMRQDPGVNGDAQRIEQMVWIFFLKVYDAQEEDWECDEDDFKSIIPEPLRWRNWAHAKNEQGQEIKDALTGDALLSFINNRLFPVLKGNNVGDEKKGDYIEGIHVNSKTPRGKAVVQEVFLEVNNYMKNGTLLRQMINAVDEIDFTDTQDAHLFGDIYEGILKDLQGAGRAGEFYTPRAVTDFIIDRLHPQLGEVVGDFAMGTGGFLVSALKYLKIQLDQSGNADDVELFQDSVIGQEWKPFPYLLAVTNLLLHGIKHPNLRHMDSLGVPMTNYNHEGKVNVIAMNPPYGGGTEASVKNNFKAEYRSSETADLFMVLIMQRLAEGGRAGIVVPDGFLFGTDGAKLAIKRRVLTEFNLHTIVRMPGSVFAPYTSIATNILFFDNERAEDAPEGYATKETWFYRLDMPEGYKHFSKTRPMQLSHFQSVYDWWNNRTEIVSEDGNEKSRCFSVEDLLAMDCNFDQCKFPKEEEEVLRPDELLAQYHEEYEMLTTEIDKRLEEIQMELSGNKSTKVFSGNPWNRLAQLINSMPERLKKSILQEAIEGRLVPQDPNDEPASVLLERIRAEKARLVKEKKIKKTALNEKNVTEEEKIFDVPDTWEWCKIETIFQHSSGKQLKGGDTKGSRHQYITTSNLYWDRFVLDNLKSMYYKDSELDRCTAQKGDLLVCEGGDVGRSAIWPYDYNICLQNHVHRLRPYLDGYTRYVFYVIWLYKSIGLIGGKGIGIKGFSASALKDFSIPLPPLAEQHRIVEKIESLLPKIEKLKVNK